MNLNYFLFKIYDSNLRILNLNARFPGSVHDAAIWQLSGIRRMLYEGYNNGETSSWLIGNE